MAMEMADGRMEMEMEMEMGNGWIVAGGCARRGSLSV